MPAPPNLRLTRQLSLPRCPHCRVALPTLPQMHQFQVNAGNANQHNLTWFVYTCSSCGGLVAGGCLTGSLGLGHAGICSWLVPEIDILDSTITGKLRGLLEQARDTLYAPAGSIMLSASAVDEVLKLNDYKEGSLYKRIDEAAEKGTITKEMARWAHQVRLEANDQRHADENASLPAEADAKRAYEFTKTLVELLVVLPARVTRGVADTTPKA